MFNFLEKFADWLVFRLIQAPDTIWSNALVYFIYDSIKIAILLISIIFISFLRSYLPPEKIKYFLASKFKITGNLLASVFGIVTPFCSCSAVPLFIGLIESGVPLGITFSYLISAPMINEVAVVLLIGLFGWKVALIYVLSGVFIATIVGIILGRLQLNHLVEDYGFRIKAGTRPEGVSLGFNQRLHDAWAYTNSLFSSVFPYVLFGVAVGSLIHGYAPANLLNQLSVQVGWFVVPLVVLIGIPLYSNAAGIIPVVKSLIEKGLPLGTSLSFMMSVTALSLPEMIILRKVLKPKLLFIYFSVVAIGIIFTGYLFNFII